MKIRLRAHYTLMLTIFIIMSVAAYSQNCDCKTNLDSLVYSVENNYAGYADKTKGTLEKYTFFKDSLYRSAKSANNFDCYVLLRSYLKYFRDPHLNLSMKNLEKTSPYSDSLRTTFSRFPKQNVNISEFQEYFFSNKIDSIEGIWQAIDFDFTVAILRSKNSPNSFDGITVKGDSIKWFPGQVKMKLRPLGKGYQVEYLKNDHLPDTVLGKLHQGQMNLGPYGRWKRISSNNYAATESPEPVVNFRQLSKDICMIRLGDGWIDNKPVLDSIVNKNLQIITHTPYLIIDLRDNGGGHIMTYDTLVRFVYSRPITWDGAIIRSSPDNIALYKEVLENPNFSANDILTFKFVISQMETNPDKMVQLNDGGTTILQNVPAYPRKVAIMVNRRTASASEMFILMAKQSDKVVLFGENTRGMLDYSDIVKPRKLPCPYLQYTCPLATSTHKTAPYIDNIGIKPDVLLNPAQDDWVTRITEYFAK